MLVLYNAVYFFSSHILLLLTSYGLAGNRLSLGSIVINATGRGEILIGVCYFLETFKSTEDAEEVIFASTSRLFKI